LRFACSGSLQRRFDPRAAPDEPARGQNLTLVVAVY
jgi:hypothetical protein